MIYGSWDIVERWTAILDMKMGKAGRRDFRRFLAAKDA
jgi:hypothetical protein